MIVLAALVSGAGRHASLDLEFDTGSLGGAVDLDLAGRQGEDLADDFQRFPQGAGRGVGAIVERPVFLHAAHDGEAGEGLSDREAQIGVLLVVAEDDVEPGAVTLDEVAFEDQRLQLGARDDRFDVRDLADQQLSLRTLVRAVLKIVPHPVGQDARLPDVEDVALRILKEVDAGAVWQVVESRLEDGGCHMSAVNRKDSKN